MQASASALNSIAINNGTGLLSQRLAIDSQGVGDLRARMAKDPSGTAKEVAQQFEALFLNMVMKSMREATPKFDEMNSDTANMFRGMYDQQLSQNLTSGPGLGLATMIEQQISRKADPTALETPLRRPQSLDLRSLELPGFETLKRAPVAKAAGSASVSTATGESGPEQFIAKVGPEAMEAARSLGLSPHLLLAHAALETGWGKKPLTDAQGQNTHNLFGIKAGASWTGKTADVLTTEYVDGVAQKRVEKFRAYDSYADAFKDYGRLLASRYGEAVKAGSDGKAFASSLQEGGYATDPRYATKLAQVSEHSALSRYRVAQG